MSRLACLILLFGLSACGFAQSSCVFNSSGSFSGRIYTNSRLGVSYTYPEGFTSQDSNLPTDPKGKSSILFAIWKSPRELETPSLVVLMDDPTKYSDPTALGYLHRIERTIALRNAKIIANAQFDLAGMKFYRLDYQFPSSNALLNTSITGQIGKCQMSFEIRAFTAAEIEKLVGSVKAMKVVPQRR